ncbi:MAG: hypothetical protein HC933_10120 [Pleurocapsa sp. SU_196_0]|nr:hypothetical protein [Pleurocapsa sp. SU_196_0]
MPTLNRLEFETQLLETITPLGMVLHLRIWRCDGAEITAGWDELQAIKNEALGTDALAFEVFPPQRDLVDEVPHRHLWVLPGGWDGLPVNLMRSGRS